MRSRSDRGQVLVMAALTISLVILSTQAYIYQRSKTDAYDDWSTLADYVLMIEQSSRHVVIASLINVSRGGATSNYGSNLDRWESFEAGDYRFGRCDLNATVASQAPYADGVWLDWGTTGKGTSSAFADFTMNLSGRGAEVDWSFDVNVTSTALIRVSLGGYYIIDPRECIHIRKIDSNVDADSTGALLKDVTTLATDDDVTREASTPREKGIGSGDDVTTAKYPFDPNDCSYIGLRIYAMALIEPNPTLHIYAYQANEDDINTTSHITTPIINSTGWWEFDVTDLAHDAMGGFGWFKFRIIIDPAVESRQAISEVEFNVFDRQPVVISVNILNEGEPSLAGNITITYRRGGGWPWKNASGLSDYSWWDFGNGTYIYLFTVEATGEDVHIRAEVYDRRGIFVQAETILPSI